MAVIGSMKVPVDRMGSRSERVRSDADAAKNYMVNEKTI